MHGRAHGCAPLPIPRRPVGRLRDYHRAGTEPGPYHRGWPPEGNTCNPMAKRLGEVGQDLLLGKVEETLLVGADLVQVDVVEAGIDAGLDGLDVFGRIGTTHR